MEFKLEKSFTKKLQRHIERYEFEVGVLNDKPHFEPVHTPIHGQPELKKYAGGHSRKQTREKSDLTTAQIFVENQKRINTNLLLEPFQKKDSDIVRFTDAFLNMAANGKVAVRRVENLLQAVVRNPILRQEYGKNKPNTADAKGFDRHLIDTAQMFKSIVAKVIRVRK